MSIMREQQSGSSIAVFSTNGSHRLPFYEYMVNVRFYPSVALHPVDLRIRSRIWKKHTLVSDPSVVIPQID